MACEKLDLSTLMELVTYELRHGKTEREVDCVVDPDISAWGDVRLITSALRILLGNAWKYTSRTEQAAIRFHTEERDGRSWYCVSTTVRVSTWRMPAPVPAIHPAAPAG